MVKSPKTNNKSRDNKRDKNILLDKGEGEVYSSEDIKEGMVFNLPNILTLLRIVLAPLFMITLINQRFILALIILTVASLSDFFDGYTARKFNLKSRIGAILDPIADIVFMTFTLIALIIEFNLPLWFASVIFVRDGIILLGGLSLHFLKAKYPKENTLGKVARFMQLFTIIFYVIIFIAISQSVSFNKIWEDVLRYLMFATALLTLVSIGIYLGRGIRMFQEKIKEKK